MSGDNFQSLVALLNSDLDWKKIEACLELGQSEEERAVEPIISLLTDEDWGVKYAAIEALGNLGGKKAVSALVASLVHLGEGPGSDWDDDTRLIMHLEGWGSVKQSLKKDLEKPLGLGLRARAIEALVHLDDELAVPPLIAFLRSEDKQLKICSMRILGRLGDERAVEPLIEILNSRNPEVRKIAADALEIIGESAVGPLITTLKDKSRFVRREAVRALGGIGDELAIGPLGNARNDEDEKVRDAVDLALRRIRYPSKFQLSDKKGAE